MLSLSPCFCFPVKQMTCQYKSVYVLWVYTCPPAWIPMFCWSPTFVLVPQARICTCVRGAVDGALTQSLKHCQCVNHDMIDMKEQRAGTGNVIRKKQQTPKTECLPGICFSHTSLSCFLFIVWCHSGFTPPIPPTSRHYGISPMGLWCWRHHLIMSAVVQLRDLFLCHQAKALSLSPGKTNLSDHPGIYSWMCDSSITKVCSH